MDNLSEADRKRAMQAVKSEKTKLENKVSKELWKRGLRFRRNVKNIKGKPDIAIKKYKTVIFIDSCFWHGCELHCILPVSNKDYWHSKIDRNKLRDIEITNYYRKNGWNILRIWEHEVKGDFEKSIKRTIDFIKNASTRSPEHQILASYAERDIHECQK